MQKPAGQEGLNIFICLFVEHFGSITAKSDI